MKGIILAAGRGSRMEHLTADRPKCMLKVGGKHIIDWQIEAMKCLKEIDEISVVSGYLSDQLQRPGVKRFHNSEWNTTNMVTSLMEAEEWLSRDECIVSYSDIIYEYHILEELAESTSPISITYDVNWEDLWTRRFSNPLSDAETFKIDTNSKFVTEIGSSPKGLTEIQGQYMGLMKFKPTGWASFRECFNSLSIERRKSIHMTDMLQTLIDKGNSIKGVAIYSRWAEIDSESDLEVAKNLFEK